jgi:1-aminocyclopropane-1-carboxylate deaminase/D-cysteine desulfhydrase-like pyridoxal-dependent ACC family enzyme
MLGLIELIREGVLHSDQRVLFLHMGGTPALHAYEGRVREKSLEPTTTQSRRA